MNQTIFVPKIAVVLICGASCTGKSTLSRKIIDAYPGEGKALFSSDEIMEEYVRLYPNAEKRIQRSLVKNNGILKDPGYEQFLSEAFSGMLYPKDLVVSDGIYVKPEMVIGHIMAAMQVRGPSPFILVGMNPNYDQHRQFYCERGADRKLPWPFVERELEDFRTTLKTDFSRQFPWVQQYTVVDPCKAKVQFLD